MAKHKDVPHYLQENNIVLFEDDMIGEGAGWDAAGGAMIGGTIGNMVTMKKDKEHHEKTYRARQKMLNAKTPEEKAKAKEELAALRKVGLKKMGKRFAIGTATGAAAGLAANKLKNRFGK